MTSQTNYSTMTGRTNSNWKGKSCFHCTERGSEVQITGMWWDADTTDVEVSSSIRCITWIMQQLLNDPGRGYFTSRVTMTAASPHLPHEVRARVLNTGHPLLIVPALSLLSGCYHHCSPVFISSCISHFPSPCSPFPH